MDDFQEYKKLAEPSARKKLENWRVAIGLQQVDDLTPSEYLIKTAKENIEGKITQQEVYKRLDAYYKTDEGKAQGTAKEEADRVSAQISGILADQSFTFAPTMLFAIHELLFRDTYPLMAGKIRKYNITKEEFVLNGDTVQYGTANMIAATLKYDFENERNFDYKGLSKREKVEHIAKFISGLWQTHPFGEGNTRTIAVFTIKYLRAMGFNDASNEMFEKNSKYFRNALVRANYQNLEKDILYTPQYLNYFFGNLLLGEKNILKNRDMIAAIGKNTDKTGKITDKLKKKEAEFLQNIIDFLKNKGEIDNENARKLTGKSSESVKKYFAALVSAGILIATGANKARRYKLK